MAAPSSDGSVSGGLSRSPHHTNHQSTEKAKVARITEIAKKTRRMTTRAEKVMELQT